MKLKSTFAAPILVIFVMLMFTASRYIDIGSLSYRENICLAIIVLQLLILVVPSAFYTKIRGDGFIKKMRLAPIGIEKLLLTLLAAFVLILGDTLLKLALYNIGFIDAEYSLYYYYLDGTSPGVLYSLIAFAVVPSVCEELMFRSLLCAEYESSGTVTAVIASSMLYAMFGMNFGYFPVYLFAGLMFALVMYITRSVFASMLCHLCYSVFELAAGETVRTIITKPQSTSFLIFAVAGTFLLALAALFGEAERTYYGYALSGKRAEYAEKCPRFNLRLFSQALLAPPFLVALLVFIIAAIQFSGV